MSADVREMHGVVDSDEKAISATERANCVKLSVWDGVGTRAYFLTPNEARYLASKLRRLARRVDERIIGP